MEPSYPPEEQPIADSVPPTEPTPPEGPEEDLRTFVGPNAGYYLSAWEPLLKGFGSYAGFNMAAFFLWGLWLPYRKMYRVALLMYALLLVESLAEDAILRWVLRMPELPYRLSALVGLTIAIVFGSMANRLYLSHARRRIAQIQDQNLTPEEYRETLRRRGGTNLVAGVLFLVGAIATSVGVFFLWDMIDEPLRLGQKLELNGGEVYYLQPITETQARRCAELLVADGYFDGQRKTVLLRREGKKVQVQFVFHRDATRDPEVIAYLQDLSRRLAEKVFPGAIVEMQMLDEYLKLLRVVPPG